MRRTGIITALVGVFTMSTASEIDKGVEASTLATNRLDENAPHSWDTAAAYFHGRRDQNYTVEGFMSALDSGFACGGSDDCDNHATNAHDLAIAYFQQGLRAIRAATYSAES